MTKEYQNLSTRINYIEEYLHYLSVNNIIQVQGRYPVQSVSDSQMDYYKQILEFTTSYVENLRDMLEKQLNGDLEKLEAVEILLREN